MIQAVRERTMGLGFELVAAGDGWMFCTSVDLGEDLRAAMRERPHRLPQALLVIAARQSHPARDRELPCRTRASGNAVDITREQPDPERRQQACARTTAVVGDDRAISGDV